MKVNVESDGTTEGTVVTDAETGKEITNIKKLVVKIDAASKNPPLVELTIEGFTIKIGNVVVRQPVNNI